MKRKAGIGLAAAIGIALAAGAAGARAQAPRRIVSINLCTDQLLMALAEPGQIAGLGRWARNSEMSFLAGEAGQLPALHGVAEEVLRLKPDLVLAGTFSGTATRAVLQTQGLRVETFTPPGTIAEAKAEIVRAATLFGQPDRGATLVARIDGALDAALALRGPPLSALTLQRRGYVAGTATLLSDILMHTGFGNAAAALGYRSVEHASLEAIAKARPDVLIVEDLGARAPDQASALLRHPVLARAIPPSHRIAIPVAELSCAGPALPAVIHRLTRAAQRVRASPGP